MTPAAAAAGSCFQPPKGVENGGLLQLSKVSHYAAIFVHQEIHVLPQKNMNFVLTFRAEK